MFNDNPFVTDCSADPVDIATDGVVEMMRLGGIEMFSMSAVARWAGRTRSAMHQRHGSSEAFVVAVTERFCLRWTRWVTRTGSEVLSPVRLPRHPNETNGVRAWRAIRLVADGERRAGRLAASVSVGDALASERRHIALHLSSRLGRDALAREVEHVVALAEGLRARVVATDASISADEADQILRRHLVDSLGLEVTSGDLTMEESIAADRTWRDRPAI